MSKLPKIDPIPGWDCYDWRNARTVLQYGHSDEWQDVIDVLAAFKLLHSDIVAKGRGNKSAISGALDGEFYARDWLERQFDTRVVVDGDERATPTHKVDCFKGKIALELEWNNKDPFYDRDLNNFRLLYDLGVADVGIIVTRATSLQRWMYANARSLFGRESSTYGISTTHFDKLEPRILGGGAGGCPVFVFAMTPELYLDDRVNINTSPAAS